MEAVFLERAGGRVPAGELGHLLAGLGAQLDTALLRSLAQQLESLGAVSLADFQRAVRLRAEAETQEQRLVWTQAEKKMIFFLIPHSTPTTVFLLIFLFLFCFLPRTPPPHLCVYF